ncbi:MAG TPA: cupin domain-containing protein [Salinisphaeraceae bacterium]|nr:cupin domain-containing protein [Salinisphaeraceae bacterium]
MTRMTLISTHLLLGIAILITSFLVAESAAWAADADASAATAKVLRSEELPNAPGKSLTIVLVQYAPGGQSPKHHHAGSVLAYVLSGAIRSQVSEQGPAKVYQAGESFFEPPGSEHLVSANASSTEPASLLAIFVAETDAELTTVDE